MLLALRRTPAFVPSSVDDPVTPPVPEREALTIIMTLSY